MCCKTKTNAPLMYGVLNKDTMKYEILLHLSMAKRGYVSKSNLLDVIQCVITKRKMSRRLRHIGLYFGGNKKAKMVSTNNVSNLLFVDKIINQLGYALMSQ